MIKKIIKFMLWSIATLVLFALVLVIGITIFVNTAPQFGQRPQGEDLTRISQSENYQNEKFVNLIPTTTGDIWKAMRKLPEMLDTKGKAPTDSVLAHFNHPVAGQSDSAVFVTWFGHSAFLLESNGKKILIDPMLSEVPSPLPFGTKRFAYKEAIPLDELTDIDLVLISHDHYDHLDYPSIVALKDEVKHFVTPLGVGSHLKAWGVAAEQITELDWWQHTSKEGIDFTACPSRHFSGRGVTDRDATQWASWVIQMDSANIYFSGDGGYGPHFKEIGAKYGPFDFAMLECGQYNEAWSEIHMMPEESVQAGIDVNAKISMPIHWGAFLLAPHAWKDPIERFTKTANEKDLTYILPTIGDRFKLGTDFPVKHWWEAVK